MQPLQSSLVQENDHETTKALKRLTKIEALISDVTERYSETALHIGELLQDAKGAITRAKDAVSLQASNEETSAQQKTSTRVAIKVPRPKAARKRKSQID